MSDLYIPKHIVSMKDVSFPQIRLGLSGDSGSGKTTSALTFPNPIVLDFDNGLTQFTGLDIPVVRFYDEETVCNMGFKPSKVGAMCNRKDALMFWLQNEGLKLKAGQTLILDSWTTIQNAFDVETAMHPDISKKGNENERSFWVEKIKYSKKLMEYVMTLRCHIVVCFHEIKVRDQTTGQLLDKVQPLMKGGFVPEIKIFFTDFYRMVAEQKRNNLGQEESCKYYWQVNSSNAFDAKCRLQIPQEIFRTEAHFKIFEQYRKK